MTTSTLPDFVHVDPLHFPLLGKDWRSDIPLAVLNAAYDGHVSQSICATTAAVVIDSSREQVPHTSHLELPGYRPHVDKFLFLKAEVDNCTSFLIAGECGYHKGDAVEKLHLNILTEKGYGLRWVSRDMCNAIRNEMQVNDNPQRLESRLREFFSKVPEHLTFYTDAKSSARFLKQLDLFTSTAPAPLDTAIQHSQAVSILTPYFKEIGKPMKSDDGEEYGYLFTNPDKTTAYDTGYAFIFRSSPQPAHLPRLSFYSSEGAQIYVCGQGTLHSWPIRGDTVVSQCVFIPPGYGVHITGFLFRSRNSFGVLSEELTAPPIHVADAKTLVQPMYVKIEQLSQYWSDFIRDPADSPTLRMISGYPGLKFSSDTATRSLSHLIFCGMVDPYGGTHLYHLAHALQTVSYVDGGKAILTQAALRAALRYDAWLFDGMDLTILADSSFSPETVMGHYQSTAEDARGNLQRMGGAQHMLQGLAVLRKLNGRVTSLRGAVKIDGSQQVYSSGRIYGKNRDTFITVNDGLTAGERNALHGRAYFNGNREGDFTALRSLSVPGQLLTEVRGPLTATVVTEWSMTTVGNLPRYSPVTALYHIGTEEGFFCSGVMPRLGMRLSTWDGTESGCFQTFKNIQELWATLYRHPIEGFIGTITLESAAGVSGTFGFKLRKITPAALGHVSVSDSFDLVRNAKLMFQLYGKEEAKAAAKQAKAVWSILAAKNPLYTQPGVENAPRRHWVAPSGHLKGNSYHFTSTPRIGSDGSVGTQVRVFVVAKDTVEAMLSGNAHMFSPIPLSCAGVMDFAVLKQYVDFCVQRASSNVGIHQLDYVTFKGPGGLSAHMSVEAFVFRAAEKEHKVPRKFTEPVIDACKLPVLPTHADTLPVAGIAMEFPVRYGVTELFSVHPNPFSPANHLRQGMELLVDSKLHAYNLGLPDLSASVDTASACLLLCVDYPTVAFFWRCIAASQDMFTPNPTWSYPYWRSDLTRVSELATRVSDFLSDHGYFMPRKNRSSLPICPGDSLMHLMRFMYFLSNILQTSLWHSLCQVFAFYNNGDRQPGTAVPNIPYSGCDVRVLPPHITQGPYAMVPVGKSFLHADPDSLTRYLKLSIEHVTAITSDQTIDPYGVYNLGGADRSVLDQFYTLQSSRVVQDADVLPAILAGSEGRVVNQVFLRDFGGFFASAVSLGNKLRPNLLSLGIARELAHFSKVKDGITSNYYMIERPVENSVMKAVLPPVNYHADVPVNSSSIYLGLKTAPVSRSVRLSTAPRGPWFYSNPTKQSSGLRAIALLAAALGFSVPGASRMKGPWDLRSDKDGNALSQECFDLLDELEGQYYAMPISAQGRLAANSPLFTFSIVNNMHFVTLPSTGFTYNPFVAQSSPTSGSLATHSDFKPRRFTVMAFKLSGVSPLPLRHPAWSGVVNKGDKAVLSDLLPVDHSVMSEYCNIMNEAAATALNHKIQCFGDDFVCFSTHVSFTFELSHVQVVVNGNLVDLLRNFYERDASEIGINQRLAIYLIYRLMMLARAAIGQYGLMPLSSPKVEICDNPTFKTAFEFCTLCANRKAPSEIDSFLRGVPTLAYQRFRALSLNRPTVANCLSSELYGLGAMNPLLSVTVGCQAYPYVSHIVGVQDSSLSLPSPAPFTGISQDPGRILLSSNYSDDFDLALCPNNASIAVNSIFRLISVANRDHAAPDVSALVRKIYEATFSSEQLRSDYAISSSLRATRKDVYKAMPMFQLYQGVLSLPTDMIRTGQRPSMGPSLERTAHAVLSSMELQQLPSPSGTLTGIVFCQHDAVPPVWAALVVTFTTFPNRFNSFQLEPLNFITLSVNDAPTVIERKAGEASKTGQSLILEIPLPCRSTNSRGVPLFIKRCQTAIDSAARGRYGGVRQPMYVFEPADDPRYLSGAAFKFTDVSLPGNPIGTSSQLCSAMAAQTVKFANQLLYVGQALCEAFWHPIRSCNLEPTFKRVNVAWGTQHSYTAMIDGTNICQSELRLFRRTTLTPSGDRVYGGSAYYGEAGAEFVSYLPGGEMGATVAKEEITREARNNYWEILMASNVSVYLNFGSRELRDLDPVRRPGRQSYNPGLLNIKTATDISGATSARGFLPASHACISTGMLEKLHSIDPRLSTEWFNRFSSLSNLVGNWHPAPSSIDGKALLAQFSDSYKLAPNWHACVVSWCSYFPQLASQAQRNFLVHTANSDFVTFQEPMFMTISSGTWLLRSVERISAVPALTENNHILTLSQCQAGQTVTASVVGDIEVIGFFDQTRGHASLLKLPLGITSFTLPQAQHFIVSGNRPVVFSSQDAAVSGMLSSL